MNNLKKILKITGISVGSIVGFIFILLLIIPFFVKEKAGDIVKLVANEFVTAKVDAYCAIMQHKQKSLQKI